VVSLKFTGKQPRALLSPELLADPRCFFYRNCTPESTYRGDANCQRHRAEKLCCILY
jgi:hypothetical protein